MTDFPDIKLKVIPTVPINIVGGVGIEATRESGAVTVDLAFNEFSVQSAIPTSPTNNVLTYDTATGQYVMVPSSLLGGAVSGISEAPINGFMYGRIGGNWGRAVAVSGDTITGNLAVNGQLTSGGMMIANGSVSLAGSTTPFLYFAPTSAPTRNGHIYQLDTALVFTAAGFAAHYTLDLVSGISNFAVSPTAPTPTAGDNTTKLATTAFVAAAVAVGGSAVKVIRVQKFLTSGTYTPHANMLYCTIECFGAGGGGGGTGSPGASVGSQGSGGGAGGYSRAIVAKATIGASRPVTIGAQGNGGAAGNNPGVAGGDTSVSTLCVGKGASGGLGNPGAGNFAGGPGGVLGSGDVTGTGGTGGPGLALAGIIPGWGNGANSAFGGGGSALSSGAPTNGGSASGFGGGGGGGITWSGAASAAGGAGSPGIAIITEFCSA